MSLLSNEGRSAYLAFVRNLPSQLLLLTPVIYFPQLPKFSVSNLSDLLVLAMLTVMLLFAMICNFLEFFINANTPMNARIDELQATGLNGFALARQTLKETPWGEIAGFFMIPAFFYTGIGIIAFNFFLSHKL